MGAGEDGSLQAGEREGKGASYSSRIAQQNLMPFWVLPTGGEGVDHNVLLSPIAPSQRLFLWLRVAQSPHGSLCPSVKLVLTSKARWQGLWKTWTEIACVVKAGARNDDVGLVASDEWEVRNRMATPAPPPD